MASAAQLKVLRSTNPRLDLFYVRTLRALLKGGKDLLRDEQVMSWCFPKTALEGAASYIERKNRAFYEPVFAMVINMILAGLAQDPLIFDDDSGPSGTGDPKQELDEYWAGLMTDATPPTVPQKKTWDEIMREVCCEAISCEFGWVLAEMPKADPLISSLADQERQGKLRAYLVPYRADQVLDWASKDSQFLWVKTVSSEMRQEDPTKPRKYTTFTWRIWDANEITTYELTLDSENRDPSGQTWQDDSLVPPIDVTPHSFGEVPWRCFDANNPGEPSLFIGGQIESLCRALFNASCNRDFLTTRALLQQLYEFLGPDMPGPDTPIATVQENPNRASRSMGTRAPDIVQIRGQDDEAKYVCPDIAVLSAIGNSTADLRESITRVTGQLALAADTTGAMIKRSGDSKSQDKIAQKILLGAIGTRLRSFAKACAELLALGRGDDKESVPPMRGYENFDAVDSSLIVEQHVALSTAPVNSALFQVEENLRTVRAVLGDGISPDLMARIREELESTITQDSINQATMPPVPPGHQLGEDGKPEPLPPKTPEEINPKSTKALAKASKVKAKR